MRALAPFIAEPLTELFNLSLLTTEVPEDWRSAIICPFFKKGDPEVTGNYRRVSLTSIVCKMMESAIKEAIMSHLLRTAVLADTQHGFTPRSSCLTNLLLTEQCMTQIMDAHESVDVVLLDFSKALDSVEHRLLCVKLRAYGIHAKVVESIQSFLA